MNQDLIIQTIYLFLLSLILAALEIQIEAEAGWARNLPTWRPPHIKWYSKLYRRIMAEKDLTGYHLLVFSLVLSILHYPYFAGKIWSLSSEFTTLSFFLIITVVWDFLWFVLNPHYDFLHFWKERVWWHKKWFLHMPFDYWFALTISALLYMRFSLNWILLKEWLEIIALFSVFTLVMIIFAIATRIFRGRQNSK